MSNQLERLERLAERLRSVEPVHPSQQASVRGWNLTRAAVQRGAGARPRTRSVRRLVLALAASATVLIAGTVAASADSLPDSPLYPVKGVLEDIRGLLAISPADRFNYHLDLARTRMVEAEAMFGHHRDALAARALAALEKETNDAASVVVSLNASHDPLAPALENRLQETVTADEGQLTTLQGNVTNPEARGTILAAQERAKQALDAAESSGSQKKDAGDAQGKGEGQSPSPSRSSAPSPHDNGDRDGSPTGEH